MNTHTAARTHVHVINNTCGKSKLNYVVTGAN